MWSDGRFRPLWGRDRSIAPFSVNAGKTTCGPLHFIVKWREREETPRVQARSRWSFMKKGQLYEGVIERLDFPNKGICHVEENKVTVKNTLPGQRVRFAAVKLHKGKAEGRLKEVLERSPLETREPDCAHYGICGSCVYRTLPYEEQCKIKEQQVKALLYPVAGEFPFEGVLASPRPTGYRNKMEFSFGDEEKDGPLTLGMHKRGSFYDVVTVTDCRIVDEDFRTILGAVQQYFLRRRIPYYHKNHEGFLRHLLVRKAAKTGEILVDLVTSSQPQPEWNAEEFAEMVRSLPLSGKLVGVLHTWNDSLADVVQSDRTDILWGQDWITEELLGLTFKITPFSFFQTNSLGAEVLYSAARRYVADAVPNLTGLTVFDLYSGTGTIAQLLAKVAKKVIGVEIVEEAVEAARENAAANGLTNCEFIAGDVLKVLDTVEEKPDLIVLDPPRDGVHPKALPKILNYQVPYLVYISCKPTSLARDLDAIQAAGYHVVKGCAVDMFPDTSGIETVVLLSRE